MDSWIAIAGAAFLVAGTIKGTLGLGLPITAIGLMTLFLDTRLAITLMAIPILFTNIWQVYRSGCILETAKQYRLFAIILAISLFTTSLFTNQVSTGFLLGLIGTAVILFCIVNLAFNPPPISDRYKGAGQVIGGLLSGFLGGFTTIWAPPIAAYLLARQVDKDEFVRGTGFLFLVGSIPLCLGFWLNGMLTLSIAKISLLMLIPTLIGFTLGEVVRKRISSKTFRTVVLTFFLLIGLNLVRRALVA